MSFRFKLATLLRLRQIAEEREERLLGQIHAQIGQTREELSKLRERQATLLLERKELLQGQISAAEIQSSYGEANVLEVAHTAAHARLNELECHRLQQLQVYETAHRDREVLSSLRENRLEEFREGQLKFEQSAMDDNFISRRTRK